MYCVGSRRSLDGPSVGTAGRAGSYLNLPERLTHEIHTRPLRLAAALSDGRTGRKSKARCGHGASGTDTSWVLYQYALWYVPPAI